jgi:hypothetical protein
MVHHFPMIARAQDGDRLFVASTGLRYLARNWKFESISLQRGVCELSVSKPPSRLCHFFKPLDQFTSPDRAFNGIEAFDFHPQGRDFPAYRERRCRLFELFHLPLPPARRLVRVLGSVIEPLVLAMLNAGMTSLLAAP